MPRRTLALAALAFLAAPLVGRADPFDLYVNPVLTKAPDAAGVKELKQLTAETIVDNDRLLPGIKGALVVVRTNEGRYAKLLVRAARQRLAGDKEVPILLIDRFVTYKEGTDEGVFASGKNVYLFPGFRFNLDLGQVVPDDVAADLKFTAKGDDEITEPQGKAKLYLVTKQLPDAAPKKPGKGVVVSGDKFDPAYFNGTYQLYDDGRRSGKLTLKVDAEGDVTGTYVSDKDGEKYDVRGKLGTPQYKVQLTVVFPRAEQYFTGYLFTGDARALVGTSRLQEREAGFYAVRLDE
jgi:hypothetical protein